MEPLVIGIGVLGVVLGLAIAFFWQQKQIAKLQQEHERELSRRIRELEDQHEQRLKQHVEALRLELGAQELKELSSSTPAVEQQLPITNILRRLDQPPEPVAQPEELSTSFAEAPTETLPQPSFETEISAVAPLPAPEPDLDPSQTELGRAVLEASASLEESGGADATLTGGLGQDALSPDETLPSLASVAGLDDQEVLAEPGFNQVEGENLVANLPQAAPTLDDEMGGTADDFERRIPSLDDTSLSSTSVGEWNDLVDSQSVELGGEVFGEYLEQGIPSLDETSLTSVSVEPLEAAPVPLKVELPEEALQSSSPAADWENAAADLTLSADDSSPFDDALELSSLGQLSLIGELHRDAPNEPQAIAPADGLPEPTLPDIEMVTELRELSIHERPTLIQSRPSKGAEPTLPDIEMVTELRAAVMLDDLSPTADGEPTLPEVELLTELREHASTEPEPVSTVVMGDRPNLTPSQTESKLRILTRWQSLCRRNPQFLDRPTIIQRLGQMSSDRHPEVRQQALTLLGQIPNRDVLPYLLAALRRDARSQKAAAKSLSQLRNLPAAPIPRPTSAYLRRSRKVVSL